MISYRQADLFQTFETVNNPCLRLTPFHEKISSQLFAILMDATINPDRFKRNLAREFPDIKVEDLEKCGVIRWAKVMFENDVRSYRDIKPAFILLSGTGGLAFSSREARQSAREQLEANRTFQFEGAEENQLNGSVAYFGVVDLGEPAIYSDGNFDYYKITPSGSAGCPEVIYFDTHGERLNRA